MNRNPAIDKATKAALEFAEVLETALRNSKQQEGEKEKLAKEKKRDS